MPDESRSPTPRDAAAPLGAVPLGRVGVVMLSAFGDTVHVLPVLAAVRRVAPASRITWVMQPGPAALVRGHPAVDEIVVLDRARGARGFLALRRELARRPFDLVLDLQTYLKAGIVTAMTRAPVKLGFDRARSRDLNWLFTTHHLPPRPVRHVQDMYLEFAEALGAPPEPVTWELGPWADERPRQRELLARFDRPVAAVVAGTSKPEKDWPADRWAAVCDALHDEHGLQPVLVGGGSPRERATADEVMRLARRAPVSLVGRTSPRELVALLDGAALVLSPDTGPLHMSVALGRPVIGLYGYTNPKRVGPYRRFHDLLIDAYGDPGEDYSAADGWRPGRMGRIGVDDVLARVARWRERYAGPAISGGPNR